MTPFLLTQYPTPRGITTMLRVEAVLTIEPPVSYFTTDVDVDIPLRVMIITFSYKCLITLLSP